MIFNSKLIKVSEKRRSVKEVELDFDKLARLGQKINELLVRKTKGSAEAYAALRFLCVFYEENLGISFGPEFEAELRKVIKKSIQDQSAASKLPS
jgi:hypothetical protein